MAHKRSDEGGRLPRRAGYVLAAVGVLSLGLASRRFGSVLPPFIAAYSGDTLWALLVYLVVGLWSPDAPPVRRAIIAWAFSCTIEISQLYHAPWIEAIRRTTLGGLILGFGFLGSDIVCYTVGILISLAGDSLLSRPQPNEPSRVPPLESP
ncbi:MAG: DUF2809 domain-containing protein [Capsulimonadales bacterium]|nr:DUF2809 domain-containing protein [Capsulimonadales bacterium]